jgi:hypothetical protein
MNYLMVGWAIAFSFLFSPPALAQLYPLFSGLGSLHHQVSTPNPEAQSSNSPAGLSAIGSSAQLP